MTAQDVSVAHVEQVISAWLVRDATGTVCLRVQGPTLQLTLPAAPAAANLRLPEPVETRIAAPKRLLTAILGHLQNVPRPDCDPSWADEQHRLFDALRDLLQRGGCDV